MENRIIQLIMLLLFSSTLMAQSNKTGREQLNSTEQAILEERIVFTFFKTEPDSAAQQILNKKIEVLKRYPTLNLLIKGSMCPKENVTDDADKSIAMLRANSAKRYMMEKGISEKRLTTASKKYDYEKFDKSTTKCPDFWHDDFEIKK